MSAKATGSILSKCRQKEAKEQKMFCVKKQSKYRSELLKWVNDFDPSLVRIDRVKLKKSKKDAWIHFKHGNILFDDSGVVVVLTNKELYDPRIQRWINALSGFGRSVTFMPPSANPFDWSSYVFCRPFIH